MLSSFNPQRMDAAFATYTSDDIDRTVLQLCELPACTYVVAAYPDSVGRVHHNPGAAVLMDLPGYVLPASNDMVTQARRVGW